MPTASEFTIEALDLLARQFAPGERADFPAPERLTMEQLRHYVAGQVQSTLARNPALLMSILYRVDVPEAEAKRILAYTEPSLIPLQLADLLIDRQIQKLRIRRAYRSDDPERDV